MLESLTDRIDESLPVPKYEQLKRILIEYIEQLPQEVEYLPYENDLASSFGISRKTVRSSYARLRQMGVIETVKKRGSRIIKRQITRSPAAVAQGLSIRGTTIGFLFSGDRPAGEALDMRGDHLPCRIALELEDLVGAQGCSLAMYDLVESQWRDKQLVLDSLQQKEITFAVVFPNGKSGYSKVLIEGMLERGIKPLLLEMDFMSTARNEWMFRQGVDFIMVNHLHPIESLVRSSAAEISGLCYAMGSEDHSWADCRVECCSAVAAELELPFKAIRVELDHERDTPGNYLQVRYDAGVEIAGKLQQMYSGQSDVLVLVSNDMFADGVLGGLQEAGVEVPGQFRIVGYDNKTHLRMRNMSTFDFNCPEIVRTVRRRYGAYLADRKGTLLSTNGSVVFSRFIKRMTS